IRVVFVYNGAENLGIECLSAYLKSCGHEVHLVFDPAPFSGNRGSDSKILAKFTGSSDSRVVDRIIELQPDVVGYSAFTANYRWLVSIAEKVKQKAPQTLNIFGGVHTPAAPHIVLAEQAVGAIVVGEGEEAMAELLGSIRNNKFPDTSIKNAGFKSDGSQIINPV